MCNVLITRATAIATWLTLLTGKLRNIVPLHQSGFVSPLEILNRWVIQALLLVDSAKTQYTRDNEGPYFCVHLDQHK